MKGPNKTLRAVVLGLGPFICGLRQPVPAA